MAPTCFYDKYRKDKAMNTKTGDILTVEQAREFVKKNPKLAGFIKPMELEPTPRQLLRTPVNPIASGRVGRNDPCPCGSGKKFKKCCLTTK